MSDSAFLDCSRYIDPIDGDYPVFLLEIYHPSITTINTTTGTETVDVLRLCSSNVQKLREDEEGQPVYGVKSSAITLKNSKGIEREYLYVPMTLSLPTIEADGTPSCTLNMFRTDELVKLHRAIQTRPTCNMYQVWASDPDTIAATYPKFQVLNYQLSQASITDTIGTDMDDSEPFPGKRFTNDIFGAVHR